MVSLENEYFNEKQLLENAQARLNKMESLDVENMTQEQFEARERVIKGAKEEIKECEEMLEEIKEELVEFINNGGEVSEKTKEAINYFEPIRVDFKIISNRNEEIYTEGYVEINDAEAEDTDWYYWNGSGYDYSHRVIWHDGVEITGATVEQSNEIAEFESDLLDNMDWTTDVILQSEEDENRTYVRENLTLIINEGAKMECELIPTPNKFLGFNQYFCEVIPRFNGEKINLAGFMEENNLILDPYGCQDDDKFAIDGSHIYCELSADYFEDGEIEYNEKVVNEDVEYIYKQYLTSELGVYGIAGVIYEEKHGKLDESGCDKFANNWEQAFEDFDVVELYSLTSEDVERIIKEELERDE